jgi:anti-sigma-K factor RskA
MGHEDYKQMLPVRALSALDASDDVALSEHLRECSECRRELQDWEATSAVIALNVQPIEPNPALRERIMSQVREENRSQTVKRSSVVPFETRSKKVRSTAASFAVIAAGLVLSVLIGWIFLLWRENAVARAELARLNKEIEATQGDLQRERAIVTLLTSPGARLAKLAGTDSAPAARAMVAYNSSGDAMLIARGLPSAPEGKGYQLWFMVGDKPVPGKVFNTNQTGMGTLQDQMPGEMGEKAVFAITMESSGGARTPTGAILLRSEL